MKLYLECGMGAAGDMLMAALYELLPDGGEFSRRVDALGMEGVRIEFEKSVKNGIAGTRARVAVGGAEEETADVGPESGGPDAGRHEHDGHGHDGHEHTHGHGHTYGHGHDHSPASGSARVGAGGFTSPDDIRALISGLSLPENVRSDALAVYALLADAEAAVHGEDAGGVHLHEVGALDAVADIVGCCLLVHMLGADDISASPIHVGAGFVRCAHGVLPVPAPATAHILRGVPIYGGAVRGELCTPTGAALLRHFVRRFGDMDTVSVAKVGYGMGRKEFDRVNCLRAFLCDDSRGASDERDEILEITCNLDDMTPEAIGAAAERIFESGALDVFTAPIYMKKNRPAVLLTCLCRPGDRAFITDQIFAHTTTIGVRVKLCARDKLRYTLRAVHTPYGDIRVKFASGHGIRRGKPEYDDAADAARRFGVPFSVVYDAAAFAANGSR
ncbi:MAG: nickel pincer cofactor biosynthesis protein LarC [Oscillospiraceae bacterium]|jgi:uncharacterized protein (TIGR00299 family) protein|nr:nickel pincer cofactor biosynthesis protein LarC [Oscillospiraceae bacterium]